MRVGDLSNAWLLAALWLAGCSFNASYSGRWYTGKPDPVRVSGPPPEAPSEVPKECQGPTVWVFGYWDWQSQAWEWISGACREPQPAGAEWVGPVLNETDEGYELVPGHWAPSSSGGESEPRVADEGKDDGRGHRVGVSISAGGSRSGKPSKKPGKKPSRQARADDEREPHGGRRSPTREPRRDRGTVVAGGSGSAAGKGDGARGATDSSSDSDTGSNANAGSNSDSNSNSNSNSNGNAGSNSSSNGSSNSNAGAGSRPDKGEAAGAGGSAGRQDRDVPGMMEAERGDVEDLGFSCRLTSKQAKSGQRLILKIKGVKDDARIFFGEDEVKVLKQTKTNVHVAVPPGFSERTRVVLSYQGERVSCGDLDPKR